MRRLVWISLCACLAASVAQPQAPVEAPGDLVLVPSSHRGAVYRALDVPFGRYQRLTIDPVSVTFERRWRRTNAKLTEEQVEHVRWLAASQFRDELVKELVDRGHYPLAPEPAPDVLRIKASIVELDVKTPEAGLTPGIRTYARSFESMTLLIELHDAASGVLVGRIIDPEDSQEFQQPQIANPVSMEYESRIQYARAAQLTREALDVAVNVRPK